MTQVRSIVERLLEVLTTPSETVQRAVSGCLPPLMGGLAADAEYVAALVQRLLGMLSADRYGDRCAAMAALSESMQIKYCSASHCLKRSCLR